MMGERFGPPAVKGAGPANDKTAHPHFFLEQLADRFNGLPLGGLLVFRESTLARTLSCIGGPRPDSFSAECICVQQRSALYRPIVTTSSFSQLTHYRKRCSVHRFRKPQSFPL